MPTNRVCLVSLVAVTVSVAGSTGARPAWAGGGYHLAQKVPVDGAASYYDYLFVDEPARRLYVSFGGEVVVFDADKLAPAGRLTGLKKVHGIATGEGRVFVTDGEADQVRVFGAKDGKPIGEVKAGKNPDAILFDPATKVVYAFNNHGASTTAFDATTLKVVATIELGGAPEFGRSDGKGMLWVNLEDKSEVVRIDTRKHMVSARFPLAPCEEPTGLAFDAKHRRLFVGCGNQKMAVLDADSGHVITTLPIGPGVDATDFDPATGDIFNSCGGGAGSLVVIHQDGPDAYQVTEVLATQKRAKTLAVDHKKHRVFLTGGTFGPAPAPTPSQPKPRAPLVPGSFTVFVFEK